MKSRPENLKTRLLLMGASIREQLFAAAAEGYQSFGIDLFADRDSQSMAQASTETHTAQVNVIKSFTELPQLVHDLRLDYDHWMFLGGLENYPEQLKHLDQSKLAGCDATCIRKCRDPSQVSSVFSKALDTVPHITHQVPAKDKSLFLRKPIRGSGGKNIGFHLDSPKNPNDDYYFQEFVEGVSMSATYFASERSIVLVGTTEQLIGINDFTNKPFSYSGSIGPLPGKAAILSKLETLGNCIFNEFRPSGFFGVDFIMNNDDVWPIEINPRMTASLELFRRAYALPIIRAQLTGKLQFDQSDKLTSPRIPVQAKAYLFNTTKTTLAISKSFSDWAFESRGGNSDLPKFGDIPRAFTNIRPGQPIMTIYASSNDSKAAIEALKTVRQSVMQEIKTRCPSPTQAAY